jgi:xanthine dehydrogenase iron-sulfur cluster and FAD-binding subunit A
VHRADFLAVTAKAPGAFVLKGVTDLRIKWSRAAEDVELASVESRIL